MSFEDTKKVRMSVPLIDWAKFLDHYLNTHEEAVQSLAAVQDRLVQTHRDLLGLEERSRAWYIVAELLYKLDPDLFNRSGSGVECATRSIQTAFEKAAKYDKIKEAVDGEA